MTQSLHIEDYLAGISKDIVCFSINALPDAPMDAAGESDAQPVDLALSFQERRISFLKDGVESCWLDCGHAPILEKLAAAEGAMLIEMRGDIVVRATMMPVRH